MTSVRGLARNPAAPLDVLLHLFDVAPADARAGLANRRDLPRPLQEAMAHHPAREIRSALARHPLADPDLRHLLLADPDPFVMLRALGEPSQRPFSDTELRSALTRIGDPGRLFSFGELFSELWIGLRYDDRVYRLAASHPDSRVRLHAASAPGRLDAASREALLADPETRATVLAAEAENARTMQLADLPDHHCHALWYVLQRTLSRPLVDHVVAGNDVAALNYVASNSSTPPDVVQALLRHPAAEVRRRLVHRDDLTPAQVGELAADPAAEVRQSVAHRADLSPAQLAAFATDPAVEVRTAVSVHTGLTEEQRAAIDIDATPHPDFLSGSRSDESPPLADAVAWAQSVNPLLRRRAARHPLLPSDLVAALADDPDLAVRVLLARHHPGAPPALLLRSFTEYRGRGREQLVELPQFPVAGLAAFADHADPAERRLVALDPHVAPEVVERLCGDPDLGVRERMAACPRLPKSRIIALLTDSELAECAAANPALPVDSMWRICALISR